jgi:hypothetical protein
MILAGWFTHFDQAPRRGIVRLNSDGSVDMSFAPVPLQPTEVENNVTSVLVQPDGKILVLGWLSLRVPGGSQDLVRLNEDGTVDASFDLAGPPTLRQTSGQNLGSLQSMALGSDGSLYVGGEFDHLGIVPRRGIIRIDLVLPPRLEVQTAVLKPDGTFSFTVQTRAAETYQLESSVDLKTWSPRGEVSSTGALTEFRDQTDNRPWEYYRVRKR